MFMPRATDRTPNNRADDDEGQYGEACDACFCAVPWRFVSRAGGGMCGDGRGIG